MKKYNIILLIIILQSQSLFSMQYASNIINLVKKNKTQSAIISSATVLLIASIGYYWYKKTINSTNLSTWNNIHRKESWTETIEKGIENRGFIPRENEIFKTLMTIKKIKGINLEKNLKGRTFIKFLHTCLANNINLKDVEIRLTIGLLRPSLEYTYRRQLDIHVSELYFQENLPPLTEDNYTIYFEDDRAEFNLSELNKRISNSTDVSIKDDTLHDKNQISADKSFQLCLKANSTELCKFQISNWKGKPEICYL